MELPLEQIFQQQWRFFPLHFIQVLLEGWSGSYTTWISWSWPMSYVKRVFLLPKSNYSTSKMVRWRSQFRMKLRDWSKIHLLWGWNKANPHIYQMVERITKKSAFSYYDYFCPFSQQPMSLMLFGDESLTTLQTPVLQSQNWEEVFCSQQEAITLCVPFLFPEAAKTSTQRFCMPCTFKTSHLREYFNIFLQLRRVFCKSRHWQWSGCATYLTLFR